MKIWHSFLLAIAVIALLLIGIWIGWQTVKPAWADTERVVYRDIYTRQWESVEQFKDWYYSQNFTLLMPSGANTIDCDDYATWVQDRAMRQGYPVSEALAWQHYYGGVYVTVMPGLHDGCLVLIGNIYYYFEPEIDKFKMVEICKRD